ncbi:MAG TPA: hypothetical protein VNT58_07185 [Gaiellaceae bacterium]|nr:hypothetical protein [Gaiellaceae bacterium]
MGAGGGETDEELILRCAWCDRFNVDGVWTERTLASFGHSDVTHGLCEDCLERLRPLAP